MKRGISTDYEDLLWKMHNDYVHDVKKSCCHIGQIEQLDTYVSPAEIENASMQASLIELHKEEYDNKLIIVTTLLVIGLVVWNCK